MTAVTRNICITFAQCWTKVEDVGPALYKCHTDGLCLLRLLYNTIKVKTTYDNASTIDKMSVYTSRVVYIYCGNATLIQQ